MYDLLSAKAHGMRKSVIDLARTLIQTRSYSLEEGAVSDRVINAMKAYGYDEVDRDEDGNAIAILHGRENAPCVLLNCHMDTVVTKEADGAWNLPPLSGEIREGFLYGLGASDCKGGLAAQIGAGALLMRSLLPLNGTLVVAATVAEENGASLGVRTLIEKSLPAFNCRPDYAILGEPTDMGLYYGHDGWVEISIEVEGTDSFNVQDTSEALYRTLSEEASKLSPGSESLLVHQPIFINRTGSRQGRIRLARRLDEREDLASVVDKYTHDAKLLARQSGGASVAVAVCEEEQTLATGRIRRVQQIANAWSIDPYCPLIERSRQILRAAGLHCKPGRWKLGRLGMGTAGGALVKEYGIPTIGFGPGAEEVAHAKNEYVSIENIIQAMYGTAAIVHGLIGVPVYGWTSEEI